MKKWFAALLCALMIVAMTVPVFAARQAVIKDIDQVVDIPDGWDALTRDSAFNQQDLYVFGWTADEALEYMVENDLSLYLYNYEMDAEIYFMMFSSDYAAEKGDLALLAPEQLDIVREDCLYGLESWNITQQATDHYIGDTLYLEVIMNYGEGEEYMGNRMLYTILDGREIYVDLYSYECDLTDEMTNAQEELLGSMRAQQGDAADGANNATAAVPTATADHAPSAGTAVAASTFAVYTKVFLLAGILIKSVGVILTIFIAVHKEDGQL